MESMLRYIISIIIIGAAFNSFGQYTQPNPEANMPERQVFVRAGIDMSRFALALINDIPVTGAEVSFDTEIKYTLFPTLEIGMNKVSHTTDDYSYDLSGNYFRLGLNYNMLKYKHRLDRNMFFVGGRYGFSGFNQQASNIVLENEWGPFVTSVGKQQLNAHWFEGVIGLRGEVMKNFYMGYTIRIKKMLHHGDFNSITPYFIPGYGDGGKKTTVGMSYSIFYAIPIKKLTMDFEE